MNEKEIPKGMRNPFDDESITCICGNDVDIADEAEYCPCCGQKLDYSCLSNNSPVDLFVNGKKYSCTFGNTD